MSKDRRKDFDSNFFDDDDLPLGELNINTVDQVAYSGLPLPIAQRDEKSGIVKLGAFNISMKGLQINGRITQEEWWAFFAGIEKIESAIQFIIGDLAVYGEDEFADITYEAIAEKTGYKKETVENYASVARNVPQEIRVPELSFNHHYHVAKFNGKVNKQKQWLEDAKENNWSVRDLQEAINGGERLIELMKDQDSPVSKARLKGIRERDKTFKKAKKKQDRREWLKYAREQAQEWEALVKLIQNLD
ncbi:MAG: hypothetical protein AAFR81_08335 [Chloroflexota bacterium]